MNKRFVFYVILAAAEVMLLGTTTRGAAVQLEAEMNQSKLLVGGERTAYLKVCLTGDRVLPSVMRPRVNVSIVIDKSGSMGGNKIEKAKEAAIFAINRLSRDDILSVIVYDSEPHVLIPATKLSNKQALIEQIRCLQAGGSTALYGGVQTGAAEMRKFIEENRVHRMILLSDGLANVGPRSPEELGRLGGQLIEEGISVTTIGIGLGYNEDLMSKLAFASDGHHYFAEDACELADLFDKEFDCAMSVVAQDVLVKIQCRGDVRPVRLLGRSGNIDGQLVEVGLNQIFSSRSKYFILEVEVPANVRSGRSLDLASVTVEYQNMKTQVRNTLAHSAAVVFVDDKTEAEKSVNKSVMASVVEQIAVERNELATKLRDEGQIDQARQILMDNTSYLQSNSQKLGCPVLAGYAEENRKDAEAVQDDQQWGHARKAMRESQTARRVQQ